MTTLAPPTAEPRLVPAPEPSARLARLLTRARAGEAAWVLPATAGVLALAAVLYIVNLTVSGYANVYYSGAAWAASQSWSAWFMGSIDPANFITVDKPPLATMVMGLSVRLFGLSPAAILLPQALMGVATVALLMATVRRTFGAPASIIAGLVTALTPAAVLIFRYNNPDALLTLLLVGSAYAFMRALEHNSLRWIALAGILVGLGFETKLLQAFLVLPVFAIVYAVAAPGSVRRRIAGLAAAAVSVAVASAWWVVGMELIPAASRAYIGGSTNNSALDLVLGYDGLGRIFGQGGGGGAPGGGGGGVLRHARVPAPVQQPAGRADRLVPAALRGRPGGRAGLPVPRPAHGPCPRRLPHVGWLAGRPRDRVQPHVRRDPQLLRGRDGSGRRCPRRWRRGRDVAGARAAPVGRGCARAGRLLGSAGVAMLLLERTPDFVPGLGLVVVAVTAVTLPILALRASASRGRVQVAAAGIALAMLLAGPAAYAVDTMTTAYSGGDPSAGPASTSTDGGPGNGMAGGRGAMGQPPSGGPRAARAATPGFGGGQGGSLDTATLDYLVANQGTAKWIVAVSDATSASQIELSTGRAVMSMGGFTGSDNALTLERLQELIASGDLRFVSTGGGAGAAARPAPRRSPPG